MKTHIFTLLLLFGCVEMAFSTNRPRKIMESFEDGIPSSLNVRGGKISLDSMRMKHGKFALRWDWIGNDALIFNAPIGYHKQRDLSKLSGEGTEKYLMGEHSSYDNKVVLEPPRGFFMWIHNHQASTRRLTFRFGRGDIVDCEFDYNLNFTGWRTVWIHYDRGDMRGNPDPDMDRLTLVAPATGSGTFYIDAIGLSLPMNPRTVGPNPQLPNIDPHPRLVTQYEHRLLDFHGNRPSFPLEKMTPKMEAALNKLNSKAEEFILPEYQRKSLRNKSIEDITSHYNKFEIRRHGVNIYGRPLVKSNVYDEYFVEMGLGKGIMDGIMGWRHDFNKILLDIAMHYRSTDNVDDKPRLEDMFINLFDYGVDQGFDVGAGLGWIHHFSYVIREYGPAMFLMRDVLEKHNRLDQAIDIMRWFYGFGQVYREDLVYGVEGRKSEDADDAQGLLMPRLYTALIMKNSPEKVRDLRHYSSFFSNVTSAYANALDEIFKPDGTTFHHAGQTLGYGGRGVHGGAAVLYMLSHSPFKASDASFQRMKKVTTTLFDCLFTAELTGPRAFASIRFTNYSLPEQFYYLPALIALSAESHDAGMAGLYKQLIDTKPEKNEMDIYWIKKLERRGHFDTYNYAKSRILPYSCIGLRRENNQWMATVRGHSKYVYPYESWGPNFFAYPTFIAYGYLDVSYPKHLDSTQPREGTWLEGYDWHRWPGVTSVYLPYEQIITSPGQQKDEGGEYPFSDQGFVGGVETVDGNSIFVLPFKGHDMFGLQSFTGKKSYFFFDDFVVCLGSNITSKIANYPVETTLIQNVIDSENEKLVTSHGAIHEVPYKKTISKSKPFWMLDYRNTGYFISEIPKHTTLSIQRKEQSNPGYQAKDFRSGKFTTVLFDHGITPIDAEYAYAVVMNADEQKMSDFLSEMKGKKKPYEIIRQDDKAHIVHSPKHSTISYAIFDKAVELNKGLVKSVSRPSTFILQETDRGIKLAIADPDLNIYDGQDDLEPDGSRVELSIYSHEWFYWPSRPSMVQVTLKGAWKIERQIKEMETAENKKARIISSNESETVIEYECRDGLSGEVYLINHENAEHN
ncbi:MAG: hypothetical protein MI975_25515 [Cytophagales bacterium]|nr:hypothetical protein [Cytophagales bacterium]